MTTNEDISIPFDVTERKLLAVQNNIDTNKYLTILFFSQCSDFNYIRMDMSEQHANMKDGLSQTVTCYLGAEIHE